MILTLCVLVEDLGGVRKEKGGFRIFTMVCLETGSMSIFTRSALDSYIIMAF